MTTPPIPSVTFRLRIKDPGRTMEAARRAVREVVDRAVWKMDRAGRMAANRIRLQHFGSQTGEPVPGGMLRARSGDAQRSITYLLTRQGRYKARLQVGAVSPDTAVFKYLFTQEYGNVIQPRHADKLAFPHSNAGWPLRDTRGVQLLTAREFLDRKRELGYEAAIFVDDAILARPTGQRHLERMFIRRDSVRIEAREPVGSEFQRTVDLLTVEFNRLADEGV